jgi:hypothetical protein
LEELGVYGGIILQEVLGRSDLLRSFDLAGKKTKNLGGYTDRQTAG